MRLLRIAERYRLDAIIVAAATVAVLEIWLNDDVKGSPAGLTGVTILWGAALLGRRRARVAAPVAMFALLVVQALIWPQSVTYTFGSFMGAFIAAGLFGLHLTTTRDRLLGAALVLGTLVTVVARDPQGDVTDVFTTGSVLGLGWLVGHTYRTNADRTAALRERAERLERERDAEARAAVAEERTRIAREMHDVVAHSLSVMVVQAEAAEEMLGIDPERARRPLSAVQDTGRTALTELRRMLGVLREMDGAADLAPQPGLAGLPALAQHVRDAGLPVTVRMEGEPGQLSATGDLQAYRIIQEGLTNALRHAGPARAEVVLRWEPRELVVQVSDDGRGYDPATDGGGHGLMGMRERVAVCGGQMTAGRRAEGGFAVVARLPLNGAAAR